MGIRVLVSQYEEILKDGREEGYLCLKNTKPEQGISRSIRMGIEAVEESESYEPGDGILFSVCDQPKLTLETLKRLMESFASSGKGICAVAAAGDEAKMGNPVIFSDRYWGELKCLMKDQGGKVVVKKHLEDTVSVPAGDEAELQDIDCRADLKPFVIVRGGGDLATGTAHRLHREGCRVLILETKRPACIRRQVSFCEAVYEGQYGSRRRDGSSDGWKLGSGSSGARTYRRVKKKRWRRSGQKARFRCWLIRQEDPSKTFIQTFWWMPFWQRRTLEPRRRWHRLPSDWGRDLRQVRMWMW